ncbi:MAG: trypsin [Chloroflexota bacterium]|nr:trypsin [Chloroflexota bacterium]
MKWITILFALFIILIIILANSGQLGILKAVNQIPYGDKVGHFILYGILTLLINLSLFRSLPFHPSTQLRMSPGRVTVISGLMLALLIGIEELSQQFFASRTVSFQDLFAGYLGVIFFSWLALRINNS